LAQAFQHLYLLAARVVRTSLGISSRLRLGSLMLGEAAV